MGLLPTYSPQPVNLRSLYFDTPAPAGIASRTPNLGERITDALHGMGMDQRQANRLGDKVSGALNMFTPLGAIPEAQEAKSSYRAGNYGSALAHGVAAAVSAVPDGGMFAHGAGAVAHSIIAPLFHGSPHAFEKFALEKIGTGEGAQAYGHGLYFAENPAVATDYRQSLSGYPVTTFDGADIPRNLHEVTPDLRAWLDEQFGKLKVDTSPGAGLSGDQVAAATKAIGPLSLRHALGRASNAAQFGDDIKAMLLNDADISEGLAGRISPPFGRDKAEELVRARVSRALADHGGIAVKSPGHLYEVKLDANPEDFLNWDSSITDLAKASPRDRLMDDYKAAMLNRHLGNPNDVQSANQTLLKQGIPGIRYLDQGSRNMLGNLTHNYVVFDPSIIDILNRH